MIASFVALTIMKRAFAFELSHPVEIEGSKKVLMPRDNMCVDDIKQLYVREDLKHQRDGAGRGSPTLNAPGVYPENKVSEIGQKIYDFVLDQKLGSEFLQKMKNGHITKDKKPPFEQKIVDSALDLITTSLTKDNAEALKLKLIHPGQPFRLNLIQKMCSVVGHPDTTIAEYLKKGVTMGDDQKMIDAGLWPDKEDKNYDKNAQFCQWEESYTSAENNPHQVQKMIKEEIEKGFVAGPMSKNQLMNELKCDWKQIAVGRMGLILEDIKFDKWRLVYDATISGLNPKSILPEHCELPGIQDLIGILRSGVLGDELVGLKVDVKSAFRRIKTLPTDWKKNVFVLDGKWYYYKCLPFGAKVSAYWWQRIAAAVHVILHNILKKWHHAGMVYVDDSLWIFPKKLAPLLAATLMLTLNCLGVPMSWHKTEFSAIIKWVGYEIDLNTKCVSVPFEKRKMIAQLIKKVITNQGMTLKVFETITGKLSWASAPFVGASMFLRAFYATIAQARYENKKYVRISKNCIEDLKFWWWIMMEMPYIIPPKIFSSAWNWHIRTDARSTPPSIGGWIFIGDNPTMNQVGWFQFDIKESLFSDILGTKIDATKRISALELLALVVAVRNWGFLVKNRGWELAFHMETDSMVAKNSIQKWKAKTPLMHKILRELVITTVYHNLYVFASHIPGEINEWADGISRLKPEIMNGLNPMLREIKNDPNQKDFWLSSGIAPWFRKTRRSYDQPDPVKV